MVSIWLKIAWIGIKLTSLLNMRALPPKLTRTRPQVLHNTRRWWHIFARCFHLLLPNLETYQFSPFFWCCQRQRHTNIGTFLFGYVDAYVSFYWCILHLCWVCFTYVLWICFHCSFWTYWSYAYPDYFGILDTLVTLLWILWFIYRCSCP